MTGILLLGFLLGMRHALEADHLAAVAALTTQTKSLRQAVQHGAVWGLGHTLTLFAFCAAMLWLDTMVPTRLAGLLELCVGVMLIILGADVIRRIARGKARADNSNPANNPGRTGNAIDARFPRKALLVGMMHGMAGSAALILLTVESTIEPWLGMLYVALFGAGSIVGMATLSIIIAIPLKATAGSMSRLHNSLQVALGLTTIGIGGLLVYQY